MYTLEFFTYVIKDPWWDVVVLGALLLVPAFVSVKCYVYVHDWSRLIM